MGGSVREVHVLDSNFWWQKDIPWWLAGVGALLGALLTAVLSWIGALLEHRRELAREREKLRDAREHARREQLVLKQHAAAQELVECLLEIESIRQQEEVGALGPEKARDERLQCIVRARARCLLLPSRLDRARMARTLHLLEHSDLLPPHSDRRPLQDVCVAYGYELLGAVLRGEETSDLPRELRADEQDPAAAPTSKGQSQWPTRE